MLWHAELTSNRRNIWDIEISIYVKNTFRSLHLNLVDVAGLWKMARRQPKVCTCGSSSTTLTEESLSFTGGLRGKTRLMYVWWLSGVQTSSCSVYAADQSVITGLCASYATSLLQVLRSSSKGGICSMKRSNQRSHKPFPVIYVQAMWVRLKQDVCASTPQSLPPICIGCLACTCVRSVLQTGPGIISYGSGTQVLPQGMLCINWWLRCVLILGLRVIGFCRLKLLIQMFGSTCAMTLIMRQHMFRCSWRVTGQGHHCILIRVLCLKHDLAQHTAAWNLSRLCQTIHWFDICACISYWW